MSSKSDLHVIYLTKNCNLRCEYCYEGQEKINEKIDEETLKSFIDKIIAEHTGTESIRVLFFGGEVFLNFKALIAGLEYIYQKRQEGVNIVACMTTNGTLINEERMIQLFKYAKFLTIEVSFDGKKETQDKFRKFKSGVGSFDILYRNCKVLLKYFPFAVVRMVVSNPHDFYNDAMFLADYGFRDFCIQGLRGDLSTYTQEDLIFFHEEVNRIKENFKTRRLTNITSVQDPHVKNSLGQTIIKKENNTTEQLYKYFLPNGDYIYQKPFNEQGFEHFTKGKDASYNLLNKKEES